MLPEIRYLIIVLTERCNLNCSYCYMGAQPEGRDITSQVIDRALALTDHGGPCHIQITGGEPTLLPEKIEHIAKRSLDFSKRPQLAIQTNATLLNRDILRICREYQIQIGVSLDGPPDIHNRQRGRVDETLKGLKLLEEVDMPFRVTTVVTSANVTTLDRLALLLAGFRNCQGLALDLLVNKGRAATDKIQPPQIRDLRIGLERLGTTLKLINSSRSRTLRLRELDILQRRKKSLQPFCPAVTGQSLAVAPDGSLFTCGQTLGDPKFSLGTLEQPNFSEKPLLSNWQLSNKDCHKCTLLTRCPGECPSRLHYNFNLDLNPACTLWQSLVPYRLFSAPKNKKNHQQKMF